MKHSVRTWPLLLALLLGALGADVSPFPAPVVVVYPLTTTGSAPPDVGGNVAILLSTKLAQLGGLSVKPFTPGTQRPQFLDSALQAGADYYITGYLTPVGTDVSLIVQVVSTHSGSIVFSTTATVRTYGDVIGQADIVRAAILRHAGRGFPAVDAPAPAPKETPEPAGGAGVNLSRALGRHERPKPTPAPSAAASAELASATSAPVPASPTPAGSPLPAPSNTPAPTQVPRLPQPAKPSPSASAATSGGIVDANGNIAGLVTQVDGDGTPAQRNYAQISLAIAMRNAGIASGMLPVPAADAIKNAKAICDANPGTRIIFASTLALGSGPYGRNSVALASEAHGCDGVLVTREQAIENAAARGGASAAIERAAASVASGIGNLLRTPPGSGS